jgi:thioredoxin-like negative regulator of GroEL
MFKKLFILLMLCSSLFSEDIRELTDENFSKATARNIVVVEFWATWNEANKVTLLEEWENFDVKIYRINIDLYPSIQADNDVVILPTIIFYDDGEEVERLQGDMSFSLKTTIEELDEIVEEILSSKF